MGCSRYWSRTQTLGINIGGLAAGVFVLLRTRYQAETDPAPERGPVSELQTQDDATET